MQSKKFLTHKLITAATFLEDFKTLETVDFKTVKHLRHLSDCNHAFYKQTKPYPNPYKVMLNYASDGFININRAAREILTKKATEKFSLENCRLLVDAPNDDYEERKETYMKQVNLLNKFLLDSPRTQMPLICYRGTSDLYIKKQTGLGKQGQPIYKQVAIKYFASQFQIGQIVPLYGFLSTSLSPNIADAFHRGTSDCCFFQFLLPAGYPGYFESEGKDFEFIIPFKMDDGTVPSFIVKSIKQITHPLHLGDVFLECDIKDLDCIKARMSFTRSRFKQKFKVIQLVPANKNFRQKNPVQCAIDTK